MPAKDGKRGNYREDLERLKPKIEDLYIHQNLTAKAVAKILVEQHGLVGITERILKQTFDKNNWDLRKKLEPKDYVAMQLVLDYHQDTKDSIRFEPGPNCKYQERHFSKNIEVCAEAVPKGRFRQRR